MFNNTQTSLKPAMWCGARVFEIDGVKYVDAMEVLETIAREEDEQSLQSAFRTVEAMNQSR